MAASTYTESIASIWHPGRAPCGARTQLGEPKPRPEIDRRARSSLQYYGVNPTGVEIFDWAEIAYSILVKLKQKSRGYGVELLKRYTTEPKKKDYGYTW